MNKKNNFIFKIIDSSYQDLIEIISLSIGIPSREKIQLALTTYQTPNHYLIGCFLEEKLIGVLGLFIEDKYATIKHLAVKLEFNRQGIGRSLIKNAISRFNLKEINAETDQDAKEFYLKCNFHLELFEGEYGPRYRCKLKVLNLPDLSFENYKIRLCETEDASEIIKFYQLNKDHLAEYETIPIQFETIDYWQNIITKNRFDFKHGSSCCLGIFKDKEVIGMINFNNIIRGAFQSCFLGYKIAEKYQGQSIMKNCLKIAISYVFSNLNLHRISANHIPVNIRSAKLLESLNFKPEGIAPSYLYINHKWHDHILTALINENWIAEE